MDALLERGFGGDLFVAPPGTLLFQGSPAAFAGGWVGDVGLGDSLEPAECVPQRQVYRQVDDAGRLVRDVVRRMVDDLPAGQPLLVPVIERGEVVRRFSDEEIEARWRSQESVIGPDGLAVDFGD